MKLSIIGAGNVATHLVSGLLCAGHDIVCIYSRTMASAVALGEVVKATREADGLPMLTCDLQKVQPADAYIISVKDDAISEIVNRWPMQCRGGVVVHTAGTIPMSILSPLAGHIGVLYPMQTFSKHKLLDFSKISIFVESNDETSEKVVRALAEGLSDKVETLSSEDRRHLHLAAVFACNFSNHLVALAFQMLERHNITPQCLLPLLDETVEKMHHLHPIDGQTGPARRHDREVMNAHLEALASESELQHIYRMLSDSIERLYPL